MTNTTVADQAKKLLTAAAGFVGIRTIEIGTRHGLLAALRDAPEGLTADALAAATDVDPFYARVWCRAAVASEVLDLADDAETPYDPAARAFPAASSPRFRLAPHMATLLLDESFPGYVGGIPTILVQPELFEEFARRLPSGRRLWWDECSQPMIEAVSGTGLPFYTRLIPDGLERIPGLAERLHAGARVTELCCGAGRGLARLAARYPECTLTGVDGDAYSLQLAEARLAEASVPNVQLVHSSLEEIDLSDQDVVLINISMHECRDIHEVTRRVRRALVPGGVFVISDFPFPERTADCRTVPGRIMSGIQLFEALIGDQLLPTSAFVELLQRHEFEDVAAFDLAPVHAVCHGTRSAAR